MPNDEEKVEKQVEESKEEVAEDASPETPEEAEEQRSDDYEGIVRRLEDIMREIASFGSKLDAFVESGALVDAGAVIRDELVEDVIEEDAEDDEEVKGIEDLNLNL